MAAPVQQHAHARAPTAERPNIDIDMLEAAGAAAWKISSDRTIQANRRCIRIIKSRGRLNREMFPQSPVTLLVQSMVLIVHC